MATIRDPQREQHALHLFRQLLDRDPVERAAAMEAVEPILRERVQALLALTDDDDLQPGAGQSEGVGQRIGPYVLLERLGQGGMGEVFLAERADGAFDREVAVKRIWAGYAPLAARFVRERQLLARLQHPHIAQLLDGGIDDGGKPWLAMELVRGQDIETWCDARNLPLTNRVELLVQVCDAVDYAHRQLIVHRDIKPSNLLVDADGCVKLLDFGIARLLDDNDLGEHTVTVAMTPAWATPEQRQGKAATTASDIYQLGLLARRLLAGVPRDDAGSRMSIHFARLRREAPASAEVIAGHRGLTADALDKQLRGDLDSIVALATAQDPDERYPGAHALAEDLTRWLSGRAVQARADERGYRLTRAARRWWPALAAGIIGIAFLGFHIHSLSTALANTERARARAHLAERNAVAAQSRAEQERNTANAVSDYFIKMFSMLGPEAIQGHTPATVEQLLRVGADGLDDVEASSERSPEALSAMWRSMAAVHRNLGDHQRALELADKAVASAGVAGNRVAMAEALRARSGALHWLGRTDEAFAATLQAVAQLGDYRSEHGSLPAKLHDDLSWGYRERGDYAKAMHHARLSIAGLRRDPQSVRGLPFVQALNNAGDTAIAAGDFTQARVWLEEGASLYPRLANPNPSTRVFLESNLATLDLHAGRMAAARERLHVLLPQTRAQFGDNHPRTDLVLTNLAVVQLAEGDAAAVRSARALLASGIATYGAEHPYVTDARGILLVALLSGNAEADAARVRAHLQARCAEPARDAHTQLVKLACARADHDATVLAAGVGELTGFRDSMPWQRRLAERWRRESEDGAR
jgi:tetratricopeptide (TPR) repeat protein